MDFLLQGLVEAFHLLLTFDREVFAVVWLSLGVSVTAILLAAGVSVPLGFLIGTRSFPGRSGIITLLHTGMAIPTVLIGLLGYALFSRRGLLGPWGLLFTPTAMIVGQFCLALPLVTALAMSATEAVDRRVAATARTLGATEWQVALTVFWEARLALLTALAAGFGRVVTEVGAAIMLGGNIRGSTRTMTTAIVLETSKGEFGQAMALGLILLLVAFGVNLLLHVLRARDATV
jgi:tungstate transport system permease protein